MPNRTPSEMPDGGDERSLNHHKEWMKKEYGKRIFDANRVSQLMDLTISLRNFQDKALTPAFKEFPCIQNANELIKELFRLRQINILKSAEENRKRIPLDFEGLESTALQNVIAKMPLIMKDEFKDIFLDNKPDCVGSPFMMMIKGSVNEPGTIRIKVVAEDIDVLKNEKLTTAVAPFWHYIGCLI